MKQFKKIEYGFNVYLIINWVSVKTVLSKVMFKQPNELKFMHCFSTFGFSKKKLLVMLIV